MRVRDFAGKGELERRRRRRRRAGRSGRACRERGELRVVATIIELARPIGVVIRKVHPHDKELADQLRRAWTSAANNATEGQHQRGNKRINRIFGAYNFDTAVSALILHNPPRFATYKGDGSDNHVKNVIAAFFAGTSPHAAINAHFDTL